MIFSICYGVGGSALLALAFYFFCYIKKFMIPQKILSVYVFLTSGIITTLLLSQYFPDSNHIFYITIISYILGTTGYILSIFSTIKTCRYLGRFFFLGVALIWISIYYTSFYLYHIPVWVNVISIIFYIGLLTAVEIILKQKSFIKNLWITISIAIVSLFNYCGLITICFSPNISSTALFTGTLLYLITLIYFAFEYRKGSLKHSEPTKLILLTLSQALVSTAGALIFAL